MPHTHEINLMSPKLWVKHFSLMPVVAICGGACVLCAGYIGYMCASKPDFTFRPGSWHSNAPYQKVKPTELRRLFPFVREIPVDPSIIALRKELAEAYSH